MRKVASLMLTSALAVGAALGLGSTAAEAHPYVSIGVGIPLTVYAPPAVPYGFYGPGYGVRYARPYPYWRPYPYAYHGFYGPHYHYYGGYRRW